MIKPIRSTLIFGVISSLASIPLSVLPLHYGQTGINFSLFFLLNLILYALLLCRWSKTRPVTVLYPLLLAATLVLWPTSTPMVILVFLALLSWIRSGICFNHAPIRGFVAEMVTIIGGAGLLVLWRPDSPAALALALWLFFLVQTLFFFIVPSVQADSSADAGGNSPDGFERACRDMQRLL